MMTSKSVRVSSLHSNPFRNYDRNPPSQDRVNALMDSIERNDLWKGIVARPNPEGSGYQIAFGHHRLEAIKGLGYKTIEIDIANLSDAQMLQFLSDENLNQGGKSPAAAFEVVVAARFMLDEYLQEAETPEEFCEWANIEWGDTAGAGSIFDGSWQRMKNAGTVGRDILRRFLSSEHHSSGWSNNALSAGINWVDAYYRAEDAKRAKEEAAQAFEKVAKEEVPDDEVMEKLTRQQEQATRDEKEAEEMLAYRDVLEMFPQMENGTTYIRELKLRAEAGKPVAKSDQLRFARDLINKGTGYRDIPRVLGELIDGKVAWEKEEKRRQKEREKQKRERQAKWKNDWKKTHNITPDQYVRENLGLFNQLKTVLETLQPVFDHIEDEELQQTFLINAAWVRDLLNGYVGNLEADHFIDVN